MSQLSPLANFASFIKQDLKNLIIKGHDHLCTWYYGEKYDNWDWEGLEQLINQPVQTANQMRNILIDKLDMVNIVIKDRLKRTDGVYDDTIKGSAIRGGNEILLRKDMVDCGSDTYRILFHELVHCAGGHELDARFLTHLIVMFKFEEDMDLKYDDLPEDAKSKFISQEGGLWFAWNEGKKRATFHGKLLPWPQT